LRGVVIAEKRCLPATEGVECHWDSDREVDSDHSHLDLMGELARHIAIPSEDRCAIPEFVLVDHVGVVVLGVGGRYGEYRPEDFLAVDLHIGSNVIEQRSTDEVSVLVTSTVEARS
jgi:hypothetical protein